MYRWRGSGVLFPCSRTIASIAAGLCALLAAAVPAGAGDRHAAMVVDANTGSVLLNEDGDEARHPASLTKMMTLYLTFEAIEAGRLSMRDRLTVSEAAAGVPPSKLGLDAGDEITVADAVRALITKSANDVAVALAERLGGSHAAFVRMMNARARDLGMNATTFVNSSGLPDPNQITTARDMITLALALQDHYPQHYTLFATRSMTYRGKSYRNHNTMLNSFTGIDGIKTGYTRASGFNLVTSVRRGGRHLIGAVFGGASAATRNGEMRVVLTRALAKASTVRSRKPSPLLIAKLKTAPKIAERKKRDAVALAAPSSPSTSPVKPFAPAKKPVTEAPQQPELKMPDGPPKYVANAVEADEAAAAPATVAEAATPVEVFKVRRVAIAPKQPERPVSPDETTDTPDSIALALMEDEKQTKAELDSAVLATEQALNETNIAKLPRAPRTKPAFEDRIAMLGAAEAAIAQPLAAPAIVERVAARIDDAPVVQPGTPPSTLDAQAAQIDASPKRVAAVEPAPAVPASARGGFAIQIGAFVSLDEASRTLASIKTKAASLLTGYGTATSAFAKDGRQLYRARFVGFDSKSAASTCNALRSQSVDCFVLAQQ